MRRINALLLAMLCCVTVSYAQPSAYSFAGSTGTYTPVTGTALTFSSQDDASTGNLPIGFTFNYNGTNQTVFAASTNGLLILGQTANGTGLSGNALATAANIIAGLWDDNNMTGGSVQYLTTGTAPNRVLIVQYTGMHMGGAGSTTNPTIDLQIVLYETSNNIQFIYGATSAALSSTTASIGLSGNSGNFLSVTPTSATAPYATTSNVTENTGISSATFFPSGTTYTFTPPPPCTPPTSAAATVTATPGVSTVAGSFTAAPVPPIGYMVVRTTTNVQPVPVDGTTYTAGNNAIGYIEYFGLAAGSWTSTGLTPSTTYYYWVFSFNGVTCSGGPLYFATATTTSATTGACALSGVKSVGPGGDYATLKAAVDDAMANGVAGPLTLELNAAYTSGTDAVFPIVLGPVVCASATNTITIRPAAGAGAKTITGSNTTAIFDVNGGNYWIIDGRQGGAGSGKDLTIQNTSTATGGTSVRFINEGANNILRYAVLRSAFASTTSGVVLLSTTTGLNGNDNNTIDNCDIDGGAGATASPTTGVATNGIVSIGTGTTIVAATNNSNNTISNCNIFNFFNAGTTSTGILLGNANTDWTVSNNRIYQTNPRTFTSTALTYVGISQTTNSMNNMLISGNIIGYASNSGTGVTAISGSSNQVRGITCFPSTLALSTIQNNTITAITQSTSRASLTEGFGAFYGIQVARSTTAAMGAVTINNNTIGSLDNSSSIAITHTSTSSGTVPSAGIYTGSNFAHTISNNSIGSITVTQTATQYGGLRGIMVSPNTGIAVAVSGNTIGGASAASGLTLTGGLSQLIGIHALFGANTVSGNTVRFLTHQGSANTGAGSTAQLIGISHNSADAGQTITQNTISNINNSATAAANFQAAGIFYNGSTSGTNVVSRNFIHTITSGSTGTAPLHYGMNIQGGTTTYHNNMIAIGTGLTNNIGIFGINDGIGTNNYYFNSVYIGGAVTGSLNTFAFNSGVTFNTRIFQNNVFANLRTNAGAGKGYAVAVGGTTPNPAGLTINNNDYWVSGAGTVLGRFNSADVATIAAWRTAVGQDAQSVNSDPNFIAPAAATPDLHITSGTSDLESAALAVATISVDFDNQTRPGTPSGTNNGLSPDMGADEFDGLNPAACTGTPASGGTANASSTNVCIGSGTTLTLTGATAGPGIQYQWQSSPAGAGTYTDIAGAIATTLVVPVVSANTDFRCVVTCGASGLSTNSSVVTVNSISCEFNVTRNTGVSYTSIAATGTSATGWRNGNSTDDNLSTAQPIGFSFPYKSVNYTQFSVSTNGYLTFNVGTTATGGGIGSIPYGYDNTQFSLGTGTVNSLAPFYDDLVCQGNPGTAAGLASAIKYEVSGAPGNRVLTVEWIGMETFSNAGPNLNFQVKLYEGTGRIEYVYGSFEAFNGTSNFTYTYTLGVNAQVIGATPTAAEMQAQQVENVQNFSRVPSNALGRQPECNTRYVFLPGVYGGAGTGPGAPANDDVATPVTLPVNNGPCISLCGTYYTTKDATASAGITTCTAGTPGTPDDDVWFSFVATTTNQVITLRNAGGFDGVLQLFSDAGTTSLNCVNATGAGLTETISATGLTPGNTYYIRVYHAGTGFNTVPDFSICVNEIVPPPANDNPCGAEPLTVSAACTPFSSTTSPSKTSFVNATTTTSNGVTTPSCSGSGTVNDIWFSFTAPASGSVNTTVTPVSGVNPAVQLYSVTSGTCGSADLVLASVTCINANSTGIAETPVFGGLTPGATYYLRVYHHPSGTGGAPVSNSQFSICVFAPLPGCPATFTPANGGNTCAAGTTLSWTAALDATSYDVYFNSGAGPATTLVSANQTATTYNTGALAPGQYAWRIEAKNANGTTVCSNLNFTVLAGPGATVSPAGPVTICAPASQTLTATSTSENAVYQWRSGTTNIVGATDAIYAANASGNYTVIVRDTITGCTDTSAIVVVTVNPQPATPLATATPTPVCTGASVNLAASASAGYTMNPAGSETFIDIDGNPSTTSVITLSDDSEHNFNMPQFTFNGITYTTARLGMNGVVALGSTTGEVTTANGALPTTAIGAGNIFLAPWWDDLDIISSPQTTIKLDTVGSKFIIQWTNTAHNFTLPATDSIKFQVQLDTANGQIHFVYDDVSFGNATYNAGASATVGIQWNSTSAQQYSFNTASLSAGQCISFTPAALNYSWAGPNGFVSTAQNPVLTNVSSLDSGSYTVTITNPVTGCFSTATVPVNVVPAGVIVWTGAVDTDWNNAANWGCGGVPTITSEVIIYGGLPRYPTLNLNVEIKKLTVRPGASVTIGTGFDLKLNGN